MPELNERRRQAVQCRLKGLGLKETAELCGMSRNTVNQAWQRYKAGGWKAIHVWKTGHPPGLRRTLTSEQEKETQRLIRDRTPDQLKMPYALWNRQAVRELIQRRYERELAVRSVGKYLKRWGFTPQKPLRKAYEQQPAAVRKWLQEEFPTIRSRAKAEGAEILWGDETGLRSDDVRGRSYAPRGMTPVVRVNQNRHGCSVISTVTNKGEMRWMVFGGALNSAILLKFLRRLIKDASRKVFLVLDNLRVHHSKPVKEWLVQNAHAMEVFHLPSYSPELNPVEIANAALKEAVTKHAPARKKGQLQLFTARFLRSLQRDHAKVIALFQKDTVRYAA